MLLLLIIASLIYSLTFNKYKLYKKCIKFNKLLKGGSSSPNVLSTEASVNVVSLFPQYNYIGLYIHEQEYCLVYYLVV